MGGNVRVTVVLTNFAIVYKGSDISVTFGAEPLGVSRLASSSSTETKFYLIVPPSLPATLQVKIAPSSAPGNEAKFDFTYWDDRMPVLESISPYLVYETGGMPINMTVMDLPVLASIAQYRIVVRQGISVVTVPLTWRFFGTDAASISFLVPPGFGGGATVELWADLDDGTSKGSNLMDFEYAVVPTTPPVVFQVSPRESSNFGGVKVSVYLSNMKVVKRADDLRVQVSLQGEIRLLDPTVDSAADIQVLSQMSQTMVSFVTPVFDAGGTAIVQIWEVGREDLAAETSLTIIDENIAVLEYSFPDVAKANEEAIIEVGVARMGDLPAVEDMYASSSPNVSISIKSAYTSSNDNAVLVVSLKRDDGVHGNVNVTLAACSQLQSCLKKSVHFTFYFRDPNAVWVNDLSPLSMYVDGRLPVTFDIENLPQGLITSNFWIQFRANNATVQSVEYSPEASDPSKFRLYLTCIVPGVEDPTTVTPIIFIPSLGMRLEVPFDFTYRAAPPPAFDTVVPTKAKTTVSAPVQILLKDFPGVSVKADIEIQVNTILLKL